MMSPIIHLCNPRASVGNTTAREHHDHRRTAQARRIKLSHKQLLLATNPLCALLLVALLLHASTLVQSLQLPRQQVSSSQYGDSGDLEARCLSCIRSVTSIGVEPSKRCEGGYYCGPFQFSYQYWAESGKPGLSQGIRDFEKCARDKQCAEQTVRAYFKKFKRDCNQDGAIDCLDMAALHKAGPSGCASDWFYKSRYWSTFNKTTCATMRRNDPATSSSAGGELFQDNQQQQAVVMKNQTLTTECLDCICEALSSCSAASANNCGSGLVCGPFAISQAYWKDGRRPGASWTACARTRECSSLTIRNYMDKYKRDCNGDGYVTCEDYAAIHRRGPMSCTNRDLLKEQYWTRFLTCRANQRPSNDANLVKVGVPEDSTAADQAATLASRGDSTASAAAGQPEMSTTRFSSSPTSSIQSSSSSVQTTQMTTTTAAAAAITTTLAAAATSSSSAATNGPAYRPSQSVADLNPTYELSPVTIEAEPTRVSPSTHFVRAYSTARPSDVYDQQQQQHHYQKPSSSDENHENSPHADASGHEAVSVQAPSQPQQHQHQQNRQEAYFRPPPPASSQTTEAAAAYQQQDAQQDQRRPVIDYNSLPTIIVSKRLEAHSTSRLSSPSADDRTPPATVSMMTTRMPPSSATPTTFAYHEMTTTFNNPASSTSQQQHGVQYPQQPASDPMALDQSLDYPLTDFAGDGGGNADRVNFDRVVSGIVANPDFSKSHPPVPEIVVVSATGAGGQQRKQPAGTQSKQSAQKGDATQTTKQSSGDQQQSSTAAAMPINKRESSKTLSPKNFGASPDDQQSQQQAASSASQVDQGDQSGLLGGLLGPSALNMSSLFERGNLNESSRIASECLDCICDASSNCDATVQCISKQREKNRCGLYMISWNQYKESDIALTTLLSPPQSTTSQANGSGGADDSDEKLYYECATDKNCAEKLIHLYIEKHQKDCNLDGKIDCYDIAAIHRVGPDSCNSHKFLGSQYWRDFNHCYATDRLTTTVQPQLQSSSQGG